jgi:hypothetical protein
MPPTTRRARAYGAANCVFALPQLWVIIAEHSGVVGAWRLTGVCRASREGAKEWLRTLKKLVLCGGVTSGRVATSEAWRLDLGELRWERMPSLTRKRCVHACCAVRGGVVVLGGMVEGQESHEYTASVEILGSGSAAEDGFRHPSSPRQRQTSQLKKSHRVTAVVRPTLPTPVAI